MSHPMGFYAKHGLDVEVIKTAGWAVARDKSLSGEYDASHMLTPMPLAMSMGAGSTAMLFRMPLVENINGCHRAARHTRTNATRNGGRVSVQRAVRLIDAQLPVALLRRRTRPRSGPGHPDPRGAATGDGGQPCAGNLDGYPSPDPFNQRAVWEKVGFRTPLTKDIWEGHPCCAFACSEKFTTELPNTYGALMKAIVEATAYSQKAEKQAGDRQGDCAEELPQPAGGRDRAGADRQVRRRPGQRASTIRTDRLRSLPWRSMGYGSRRR